MVNKKINGYEYIKSSAGIHEYRLKANNLRVLAMEDKSAPVATFMVTYHVGSRNEANGHTGATHLLEHLMFKGSKKFNKEMGTSVWTVLQDIGAQINATTWMDRTNYFELIPKEHLETAIQIEADRMRNAFIRDEDRQSEMTVVINEFERGENSPFQALDKLIWGTAYQAHPYHHSTIGWRSDIENVPTARLKEFYDTFYWPNNATATVIGDINLEEALSQIKKHFGVHSSSPHTIPEVYTEEPKQEGPRRVFLKRSGQTGIIGVAHKMPHGLHKDMGPLQILGRILYGGKSSRFYKKLVEPGIATAVSIENYPLKDNGLFVTYAFVSPELSTEKIEKIILEEYENIKTKGVTADEIRKAKAGIRTELAFSRDGSYSVAANLNEAIATGDWTSYTNTYNLIEAVTGKDILRVAKTYLIDDAGTTGIFMPKKDGAPNGQSGSEPGPQGISGDMSGSTVGGSMTAAKVPQEKLNSGFSNRVIVKNPVEGITLQTLKTGVKDVVTIMGSIMGGDRFSPKENSMVAELTAAMLDQGTKTKTKYEISDALENIGASISFSSGSSRIHFNAQCLRKDVSLIIELLAEQLKEPAFNKEDLKSVRSQIAGYYERKKENTQALAMISLTKNMYPENHPNYLNFPDETLKDLENIKKEDIVRFHKNTFGLGNAFVVATGDVPEKEISTALVKHFSGWQNKNLKLPKLTEGAYRQKGKKEVVTVQDKTSVDIYLAVPVFIDRTHSDFNALMLGAFILGGNFSARLMTVVRDQMGLTYGINSGLQGAENNTDGFWFTWGTFAPDNIDKGKTGALSVIKKWIEDGITKDELEKKKNTITGTFKVAMATTSGLAGALLVNAERGQKVSYLDEYPDTINNISLKEINTAIKKYIDLDKLYISAAGTINKI